MPLNENQIEDTFSTSDWEVKSFVSDIMKLNVNEEQNRKTIVAGINKMLSSAKTRVEGLELLITILPAFSFESSENSLKWLNLCLIQQPVDICKEQKLSTLSAIIEYAPKDQEFNKRFVGDYLAKIVESCVSTPLENVYQVQVSLDCLITCMKYYASSVGPFKNKIDTFVVKMLDNENNDIVQKAGHTFLLLQQVGGAGVDGSNHIKNFSNQFGKLCLTVHSLYDVLFENVTEIESYEESETDTPFTFNKNTFDSIKTIYVTTRRLRNCLCFIKYMISKKFSATKETKPKQILDVIIRGLSVHHCLSENVSSNTYHFTLLLNIIQKDLLHMLQLTINWYQSHLLPFCFTISKLLLDCLSRSQKCDCFTIDCAYKEAIYKTIIAWIKIAKSAINNNLQHQLITAILHDVKPVKQQVVLNINNTVGLSSKAKSKAIKEKIISSAQNVKNPSLSALKIEHNEKSCKLALDCLKHLFNSNSLNLKDLKILQDVYNVIFKTLLNIQSAKVTPPYNNIECQALLYEIVVAIYDHETLSLLPPLQMSIDLLNHGANSPNRFIAKTCEIGLNNLERLCHPICPSLLYPYFDSATVKTYETLSFEDQNETVHKEECFERVESNFDEQIEFVNKEECSETTEPKIVIISNEVISPPIKNKEKSPQPELMEEAEVISSGDSNVDENLVQEEIEGNKNNVEEDLNNTVISIDDSDERVNTHEEKYEKTENIIEDLTVDDEQSSEPPKKRAKVNEIISVEDNGLEKDSACENDVVLQEEITLLEEPNKDSPLDLGSSFVDEVTDY